MKSVSDSQTWANEAAAKVYNNDDVYRVRVVFPDMWAQLSEQAMQSPIKNVLDYGCGGGLFFKTCPEQMAHIHFTGYDVSQPMLASARDLCGKLQNANIAIVDALSPFEEKYFDAITCIAVWPNWSSHEMCVENLKKIHRLLSDNGKAYFAVTNPQWVDLDLEYEFHLDKKDRLTPGVRFEITRRGGLHKGLAPTINYCWPLFSVTNQLREAGFCGEIEISEYPPFSGAEHNHWTRILARPT